MRAFILIRGTDTPVEAIDGLGKDLTERHPDIEWTILSGVDALHFVPDADGSGDNYGYGYGSGGGDDG